MCYPPSQFNQSCPITDFNIVDDSQVNVYRNLGYTLVKYAYAQNSQKWVVFSKNINQLPITTTKVDLKPCLDPHLETKNYKQNFYITEMTPEECRPEYNTGILNDERYQQVKSWSTDEYTAQNDNGILQKLTSLPQYDYQVGGT